MVVDGATGLENIHLTDAETDAVWMSNRLCTLLNKSLPNTRMSLMDILKKVAHTIKIELDDLGYTSHPTSYPSASIAIVRQKGKFLECLTLGDASIILSSNGQFMYIYDESVALQDKVVIDRMIDIHTRTGCNVSEARQKVNEQLVKNRHQMNKRGAYYIFEPTGKGISHSKNYLLPCASVQFISLMTDGFSAVQSCYRLVDSHEEMMTYLIKWKAYKLLALLKTYSRNDPTFNRFPRFKLMDDASVIVARNTIYCENTLSPLYLIDLG